jgi:hypothetical protein
MWGLSQAAAFVMCRVFPKKISFSNIFGKILHLQLKKINLIFLLLILNVKLSNDSIQFN